MINVIRQDEAIYVIAIIIERTRERYVFTFTRKHIGQLVRTLAKFAEDPELSLTAEQAASAVTQALTTLGMKVKS